MSSRNLKQGNLLNKFTEHLSSARLHRFISTEERRKIKQLFMINGRKKNVNGTEIFLTEDLLGRI